MREVGGGGGGWGGGGGVEGGNKRINRVCNKNSHSRKKLISGDFFTTLGARGFSERAEQAVRNETTCRAAVGAGGDKDGTAPPAEGDVAVCSTLLSEASGTAAVPLNAEMNEGREQPPLGTALRRAYDAMRYLDTMHQRALATVLLAQSERSFGCREGSLLTERDLVARQERERRTAGLLFNWCRCFGTWNKGETGTGGAGEVKQEVEKGREEKGERMGGVGTQGRGGAPAGHVDPFSNVAFCRAAEFV